MDAASGRQADVRRRSVRWPARRSGGNADVRRGPGGWLAPHWAARRPVRRRCCTRRAGVPGGKHGMFGWRHRVDGWRRTPSAANGDLFDPVAVAAPAWRLQSWSVVDRQAVILRRRQSAAGRRHVLSPGSCPSSAGTGFRAFPSGRAPIAVGPPESDQSPPWVDSPPSNGAPGMMAGLRPECPSWIVGNWRQYRQLGSTPPRGGWRCALAPSAAVPTPAPGCLARLGNACRADCSLAPAPLASFGNRRRSFSPDGAAANLRRIESRIGGRRRWRRHQRRLLGMPSLLLLNLRAPSAPSAFARVVFDVRLKRVQRRTWRASMRSASGHCRGVGASGRARSAVVSRRAFRLPIWRRRRAAAICPPALFGGASCVSGSLGSIASPPLIFEATTTQTRHRNEQATTSPILVSRVMCHSQSSQ